MIARRNPLISADVDRADVQLREPRAGRVFARAWVNNDGHIFVFLVITVAAAEAAIGLAIVVVVFRKTAYVDVDEVATLAG